MFNTKTFVIGRRSELNVTKSCKKINWFPKGITLISKNFRRRLSPGNPHFPTDIIYKLVSKILPPENFTGHENLGLC
mgnify:CR=1 FL=1